MKPTVWLSLILNSLQKNLGRDHREHAKFQCVKFRPHQTEKVLPGMSKFEKHLLGIAGLVQSQIGFFVKLVCDASTQGQLVVKP